MDTFYRGQTFRSTRNVKNAAGEYVTPTGGMMLEFKHQPTRASLVTAQSMTFSETGRAHVDTTVPDTAMPGVYDAIFVATDDNLKTVYTTQIEIEGY